MEYVGEPQTDTYEGAAGSTGAVRLVRLFPGGDEPTGTELYVGLIVLGALGFLILTRRGLRGVLSR